MKTIIAFLTALIYLLIAVPGQAVSQNFFSTKGTSITGPDGKPFHIRGTNLGNWLVPEGYMFGFQEANSPRLIGEVLNELIGPAEASEFWRRFLDSYITRDDIRFIRESGMNSIRIPFNYRLFTNETYMGGNDSTRGFRYLDRVLGWCREAKLYVILDMHCAPGGQTGDNIDDGYGYPFLFESAASQEQCIQIWKRIAEHYRNEKTIIGYDLLNEPIAHYFDKASLNPRLEPLYRRITKAIRSVDKNHILFLGGAQWDSDFSPFGAPFDPLLVYTFHKYWTELTVEVVQPYIDFSQKYQVPVYCGETGENTDEWVSTFRKMLDSCRIGWHFWPYKKLESTQGIMRFDKPAGYDSIIAYANAPRTNFESLRKLRPSNMAEVKEALDQFLRHCRFENCHPNTGYMGALGFHKP